MDYTITYRILNDEENDKDEVMTMNADFSRTLALLRQEKGISQRKAAKELGISQALLSHYENGIREPGLAFVKKACDFYHVSADYLLGRTLDRDGGMIDAESLYDSSDEKGTLRGSIAATLQKKMLVNTAGVLFELLGKTNDRRAAISAGRSTSSTARCTAQAAGKRDTLVLTQRPTAPARWTRRCARTTSPMFPLLRLSQRRTAHLPPWRTRRSRRSIRG